VGAVSNEYCRANQTGIDFLVTDLDLGLTFMDVAEVSRDSETVRRNYDNARTAYDKVEHLSGKLTPNAKQRQAIDAGLALLKMRLQAVGYQW
jgi:hypothetical protein